MSWPLVSWQVGAAIAVWVLALVYLVWKVLGPKLGGRRNKPRMLQKPDVKAGDLVRRHSTRRGSRTITKGD